MFDKLLKYFVYGDIEIARKATIPLYMYFTYLRTTNPYRAVMTSKFILNAQKQAVAQFIQFLDLAAMFHFGDDSLGGFEKPVGHVLGLVMAELAKAAHLNLRGTVEIHTRGIVNRIAEVQARRLHLHHEHRIHEFLVASDVLIEERWTRENAGTSLAFDMNEVVLQGLGNGRQSAGFALLDHNATVLQN